MDCFYCQGDLGIIIEAYFGLVSFGLANHNSTIATTQNIETTRSIFFSPLEEWLFVRVVIIRANLSIIVPSTHVQRPSPFQL
jgi:hypothetical protein